MLSSTACTYTIRTRPVLQNVSCSTMLSIFFGIGADCNSYNACSQMELVISTHIQVSVKLWGIDNAIQKPINMLRDFILKCGTMGIPCPQLAGMHKDFLLHSVESDMLWQFVLPVCEVLNNIMKCVCRNPLIFHYFSTWCTVTTTYKCN